MTSKKMQQILFALLVVVSFSSALYLNVQAKALNEQGFEISYLSPEDAEAILPDVKFMNHFIEKFISTFTM